MENEFSITNYKPFKDFRGQCKFKSIGEKKMIWSQIDEKFISNRYIIRPIKENEIEDVVQLYRVGFPEPYSNYEFDSILWPDRLLKELQSTNGFMKGDSILIVTIDIEKQKLVGAIMLKMNQGNMSIYWQHAVVHPDYRGQKIYKEMCKYCDKITEDTGAEYASGLAVTFHVVAQKVLESLGWTTRGIFPGAIAIWNHEDQYCRTSLIYFDKFYNRGEELVPKEMELTPKLQTVSECLKL